MSFQICGVPGIFACKSGNELPVNKVLTAGEERFQGERAGCRGREEPLALPHLAHGDKAGSEAALQDFGCLLQRTFQVARGPCLK